MSTIMEDIDPLSRKATDKDLRKIAAAVGFGWEILATHLGVSSVKVDQIKDENRRTTERTYQVFLIWSQKQADRATLRNLFYHMFKAGWSVNWSREEIARELNVTEEQIRKCKESDNIDSGRSPPERAATGYQTKPWSTQRDNSNLEATLYDGRLIQLNETEMSTISKACSEKQKPIGQGSFGIVYYVEQKKIPRLGMDLAVKAVQVDEMNVHKEMIVSRILNPFVVPMLARFETKDSVTLYLVYPYFARGDLYQLLKNKDSISEDFRSVERKRICYQLAAALSYLHTGVQNVRSPILHKDVCSSNILLDLQYNARLTDFGMAREDNDLTAPSSTRHLYAHPDVGTGKPATKYWDYYAFGVVIREILTGLTPEGIDSTYLKNMTDEAVMKCAMNYKTNEGLEVWLDDDAAKTLCCESSKCLGGGRSDSEDTQKELDSKTSYDFTETVKTFRSVLYETGHKVMARSKTQTSGQDMQIKCDVCMFNSAVKTVNHCSKENQIRVCMPCEKNSFLNPLTCFTCGYTLKREIGDDWGALLVAGSDQEEAFVNVFKDDVENMRRVITCKAPLIIGMREENVKQIFPENDAIVPQIKKAISYFRAKKDVTTLMIYFSCHGKSAEGICDQIRRKPENESGVLEESTENSQAFLFGEESMLLDEFERELKELISVETFIIILDMCYPPVVTVDESKNVLQINSSSLNQTSKATVSASKFSRYLIQGLKGSSEKMECTLEKNCSICEKVKKSRDVFLTVQSLFTYVQDHMEKEISDKNRQEPYMNVKGKKIKIAYNTEQPVLVQFDSFVDKTAGITLQVGLQYLTEFKQLKDHLLEKFEREKNETMTIRAVRYRRDQPEEECDTLEKVMAAWVNRYPLYVQFHPRPSRQS